MKKIQAGYQNEFYFVLEFNNKKVGEVNPLLREIIDDLFINISENSLIKSWRNHNRYEKADIFIKINSTVKAISIKMGSSNSIHVESIETFKKFLKDLGVNKKIIDYYEKFHYGIDKENKNKILSGSQYKEKYQDEIDEINCSFTKINIEKVIDRFILNGRFKHHQVDGIIYGTSNDFFWINKHNIKEIVKNSIQNQSNGVHIGCLFIQPLNRCLNENTTYKKYRDFIQIKWYSLFDDIIKYKNENIKKEKNL